MKQSLQLNISQSLKLTPQLQQAIKLLQLSSLELQDEIQELLESNPMLEADETNGSEDSSENIDQQQTQDFNELTNDTDWDKDYTNSNTHKQSQSLENYNFENFHCAEQTLHDYLLWQLNLTPFSDTDKNIALAIIESIDDDGFLHAGIEDIKNHVQTDGHPIENDEVAAVLRRIQCFDPVGVAARDLKECLLIQLNQLHPDTTWLQEAIEILENHIDLIASKNYLKLSKVTKLNQDKLGQVLQLIQTLNPRPGSAISPDNTQYIAPDVFVKKVNGSWRVELNNDLTPSLRINENYSGLVQRANKSAENSYLKDNLQEARWFLKSLQSRNETLMRVAIKIVEHQKDFFENGPEAMKPLVLNEIAENLGLHESTVSRVTTQKYMHTPQGIFELKYFFSSHVSTSDGGECSSTAIRAQIKKIIADEDQRKPLSDNKITQLLKQQGINVARRTIAKYREAMNILPSHERKSLISS